MRTRDAEATLTRRRRDPPADCTMRRAWSAEFTCGTLTTPAAPMSSAFLIGTSSPDAIRMMHGVGLAAWSSDCICEVSSVECSASMNSQSNPASAMSSATAGELRVINGAKRGPPARSRALNDCGIRANVIQVKTCAFEIAHGGSCRRVCPTRPCTVVRVRVFSQRGD